MSIFLEFMKETLSCRKKTLAALMLLPGGRGGGAGGGGVYPKSKMGVGIALLILYKFIE